MKRFLSLIVGLLTSASLWAAQIGDSVEKDIAVADRVNIPANTTVPVITITLDDGVWAVSGQLTFFCLTHGTVFVAGNIDVTPTLSTDGRTLFNSGFAEFNAAYVGLGLPSHTIEINGNGVPVFLLGAAFKTIGAQPVSQAWGFLSARKIRNNH